MRDSLLCVISTKIERKIASSETIVVSMPYGYGSNGLSPEPGMFHAIHRMKIRRWSTRNGVELATPIIRSAQISIWVRFDACCALIARNALLIPALRRMRRSALGVFAASAGFSVGVAVSSDCISRLKEGRTG